MPDTTIQEAFEKVKFPFERLNEAGVAKATARLTPKEGEEPLSPREIDRRVEQLISVFIRNQNKYLLG